MVEPLGLGQSVFVDTANGFQGDEREVMIFSPVVADGMSDGASRWVGSPPNLINVAVTRARDALFVVADLGYCQKQDGILGELVRYCGDVEALRKSSLAELELFSWMISRGWEPTVHPQIGKVRVSFSLRSKSGQRLAIDVERSDGSAIAGGMNADAREAHVLGHGHELFRVSAQEVLQTPYEVVHQLELRLNSELTVPPWFPPI
jgi:very-short-patch-repair endonuclease